MKEKTKPATTTVPPLKAAPQTRRYDEVFQQAAVANWIKTGQSGTKIARELGISYPSLKEWKRRYYGDALPERDDLAAENRALKVELARVREQRDNLKKIGGHLQRTVQERYAAIESIKAEHSLSQLCAAFDVKRSGYHAWVKAGASQRECTDAVLQEKMRGIGGGRARHASSGNWLTRATGMTANALPGSCGPRGFKVYAPGGLCRAPR